MIATFYTAADVPALAALHRRAFPDFFLSHLGEPFLRQLYLGYLSDSDAVISVARAEDGRVVGVCLGSAHPAGFFSRLLRRRLLGFLVASGRAIVRDPRTAPRLLSALRYRGDVPRGLDGALLSSLCVDPDMQSAGVGRELDEAWRARAAELGARSAFLTTDADGNDAVNRFYRRGGWVLSDRSVTPQGRRMNRYRHELSLTGRDASDG